MRTAMQQDYIPILVKLHPAQVESLDHIKALSHKDRSSLIREAISILIGRYTLAERGRENDVKVA